MEQKIFNAIVTSLESFPQNPVLSLATLRLYAISSNQFPAKSFRAGNMEKSMTSEGREHCYLGMLSDHSLLFDKYLSK